MDMNPLLTKLVENPVTTKVASNPHLSAPAVVYVGAFVLPSVLKIWMPGHAQQWDQTAHILQHAAATYGFTAGFLASSHGKEQPANPNPPKP